MPELNKQNERLASVEGKVGNSQDTISKLIKEQARLSAQLQNQPQINTNISLKQSRGSADV